MALWTPTELGTDVKAWHLGVNATYDGSGYLTGIPDETGNGNAVDSIVSPELINETVSATFGNYPQLVGVPPSACVSSGAIQLDYTSAFTVAIAMYASSSTVNGGGNAWYGGLGALRYIGGITGTLGLTNGTATALVNTGYALTADDTDRVNIFIVRYDNTVEKRQINGYDDDYAANAGFTTTGAYEYCYFNRAGGGNAACWGGMGLLEGVFINRALTDDEVDKLAGYLHHTHAGLTAGAERATFNPAHPYVLTPPEASGGLILPPDRTHDRDHDRLFGCSLNGQPSAPAGEQVIYEGQALFHDGNAIYYTG